MNYSNAGKAASAENFRDKVLQIIRKIPRGKVLTYGQVAALAGVPRASRIVGGILYAQGPMSQVPWQRVINAKGGLSTYRVGFWEKQRAMLKREGIILDAQGHLDLKKHQWWPEKRLLKKFELNDEIAESISRRFSL